MSSVTQKGLFCSEGEYWTVAIGARALRLKDSRGLAYIAYLLRHPGTEFHVLDLAGGIASGTAEPGGGRLELGQENLERAGFHIGNLGDAGEQLDDQAKREYRHRLDDLREELEEAKGLGSVQRADQLEQEIDALTRELSRAVGLSGRSRRAASASERARQSITKAIRAVTQRIARNDTELGKVFSRSIKTGTFCTYQTDPDRPISWEFAATDVEPPVQAISRADATSTTSESQVLPCPLPFVTAQRTAFVGRESETAAIRAAIDRACDGSGSLLMLGGGPGVGKTRLALEMGEFAARHGLAYFLGRCYERDEPLPYLPFVELIEAMLAQTPSREEFRRQIGENAPELAQLVPKLRRIFSDIPEPMELPDQHKRRYIFQSVTEALGRAARIRPHLLILDDLHWADESSLALLNHLAERTAQIPLVIIGTYRDQYSAENPALARTLEELIREGVRPLKLTGLPKDDVARMLTDLSQRDIPENLSKAIFEESNGNPFFVEEVYRHLSEEGKIFDNSGQFRTDLSIDEIDVPDNVRLIIVRRLQRFNEVEKRVLSAAAVIGRSFSFHILSAICQVDIDELFNTIEKAQQVGLIVPSAEGPEKPFTFAHELVRQTLLVGMSAGRRQQSHAHVAAAIEQLYPTAIKEYSGEIADHLLNAGAFAKREALVYWLTQSGESALEAAAFDEARANFECALSRVDRQDSQRAKLLFSLGLTNRGLGRWKEAHAIWDEALEIFTTLDDQQGIAKTCLKIAEGAPWSGKRRETLVTAERLLAKLSTGSSDRAFLLAILALGKLDDDEPDVAQEAFITALSLAEELPAPAAKGAILAFRSKLNFVCLRLHEALEDSFRSGELLNPSAGWIRAEQLSWRKAALLHLGRIPEAENVGRELQVLASRIGHLPALSLCRRTATWTAFSRQPNVAQLEAEMRREVDAQIEPGLNPFFMAAAHLSTAEFLGGNWEPAMHHAESAWSPETPRHVQAMSLAVRLRPMAYSGQQDGALTLLNRHGDLIARAGKTNIYGSWMLLLAAIEGLFVLREHDRAAALYPPARELVDTGTTFMHLLFRFPQTVAGIAAAAGRNWDLAKEHFSVGLQQAESFPNQIEQAEIRRFYAMMLLDRAERGDREAARSLLSEALESYARIGMPRHVELTRALIGKTAIKR